jgi:hypothetical protein
MAVNNKNLLSFMAGECHGLINSTEQHHLWLSHFFLLWRFDPIPGRGLPLRGFTITLTGRTTLGRTLLDE